MRPLYFVALSDLADYSKTLAFDVLHALTPDPIADFNPETLQIYIYMKTKKAKTVPSEQAMLPMYRNGVEKKGTISK